MRRFSKLRWATPIIAAIIALFLLADVWFDIDYRVASNSSLLALAVLVNAFTVRYAFWSRWNTNRIGRIYLAKSVFLSLVLDQIAVTLWLDANFPGRQHVRFVIYTVGAIAYVFLFVSLVQEQKRDRKALEEFERIMPMPR